MSTLALSSRPSAASPPPAETARASLRRQPFPPDATIGIPYYDDEFDMAQSTAHSATIRDLGQFLDRIADWTGLSVLSDNPVWYWVHEDDAQRILYPDYALADTAQPERALATDLRLALEVVSTERPEKERKDTERMRNRNAANGVPEFGLLYPEPDDPRSLRWFQLDPSNGVYRETALPTDRRFRSQAVRDLELEVLEPVDWRPGRKVRLWYRGTRIPSAEEEAQRAEREARRAEDETRRADAAEAENARLRALLRQAGLAPE